MGEKGDRQIILTEYTGGTMMSIDEKKLTKLFDPIKIGHLEIKNRIAFAPTGMGTAGPNGSITDQTICHYSARAKGGAGLIIIEHSLCTLKHWKAAVPILSFHNSNSMVWMKDLADAIHYFGAKVVVQLSLGLGRQSSPRVTGTDLVAPSSLPYFVPEGSTPRGLNHFEGTKGAIPRELTTEEVMELEAHFLSAAMRIKRAGFDGIEIHGAHGYLLADFISPLVNKREDRYGGSFEKRLTLPLNLIRKTREKAGQKFVLGFRISGDEHVEGGLTLQDNLDLVPTLARAGLDYIHLSSGRQEAFKNLFPEQEGTILPEAEAIKAVVDIPVICPNIHDPVLAEKVVQENRVDVVSLSRGLLADPDWPNKAQEGRVDEIRHCAFCYNCLKSLWNGLGTRCSVNPEVGHERFIAKYQPFEGLV
jgi:2,4-dienoyl-CoA reductase-like NADH-dependent reductase (Old Yellow Enzyme family)